MSLSYPSLRPVGALALGVAVLLAANLLAVTGSQAESLKPFFGHFSGEGVANSEQVVELGLKERDLDVVIEPAGDGMTVNWTTVVRRDGEAVKRSTTTIEFKPTDDPNVFKAVGRDEPLGISGYSWAAIDGHKLTVYILAVDARTGSYNLHSYERTLKGATGMELKFLRIKNGKPKVIVQGTLKRK